MKKLFFLSVLVTTFSYAQVIDETGATVLTGNIGVGMTPMSTSPYKFEVNGSASVLGDLKVGENNGNDIFKIGDPTSSPHMRLNAADGKKRLDLLASPFYTNLQIFNINEEPILWLASDFPEPGKVFLFLEKLDSRLVVGGTNYLPEHKFVVKDGSAMIEGNILTDANIGIGTSSFVDGSDTYRLSVEGKVRAHAIKVYTDWADYVFEEDYKLPTLTEVENYINENGHLKDIPSAKKVEENGIEVGEMNKLLLQKIEELTLYVIELNKEIEELKTKK